MAQSSFNPKARWDRDIPISQRSNQELNEKIQVLAWFKNGKIFPRGFLWNNKEYKVECVTYHWQERIGNAMISYICVSTDSGVYQISFNPESLSWRLDKTIE